MPYIPSYKKQRPPVPAAFFGPHLDEYLRDAAADVETAATIQVHAIMKHIEIRSPGEKSLARLLDINSTLCQAYYSAHLLPAHHIHKCIAYCV